MGSSFLSQSQSVVSWYHLYNRCLKIIAKNRDPGSLNSGITLATFHVSAKIPDSGEQLNK